MVLDNYIFAILAADISKVHFITTIKPLSLSHGLMTLAESRGFYLYVEVLTTALNDGIVTDDEASILKVLSTALGVSPANTGAAMDIARGIDKSPFSENNDFASHKIGDATTYQSALVAALDDEVISEDEGRIIDTSFYIGVEKLPKNLVLNIDDKETPLENFISPGNLNAPFKTILFSIN